MNAGTSLLLPTLPPQPDNVPWPTNAWPTGPMPDGITRTRFHELMDYAFKENPPSDLGETHATVIIQGGRLLYERYWTGFDANTTCHSWSKAKSITHALIGILVGDGLLDISKPANVPEWQQEDDPRRAITLDQLLRMSSGLAFQEDYVPDLPSDVIAMLWGEGKQDVAHFAASFPLAHAPNSYWSYASGTTNIISRIASIAAQASGSAFETFMRERLFNKIGMKSPVPKFDATGTFIGSSFCFCTPQDFARFGLLYLRDGTWAGQRILPEGWVDYARTPTWQQPEAEARYGAHWWLDMAGPGSFSANGFEGQYTVLIPDLDLIIVRHGKTPLDMRLNPQKWITEIVVCFREAMKGGEI